MSQDLIENDISCEEWREYKFGGVVVRIDNPIKLYFRKGGSTHRVSWKNENDEIVVTAVPNPSIASNGCVLTWKSRDQSKPVEF